MTGITQKFSWRPTYDQAGIYSVTFEVSDGKESSSEVVGIVVNDVNRKPVVKAKYCIIRNTPPFLVYFSSKGTYDPDKDKLTYLWDFGDGKKSNLPEVFHIYRKPGIYRVTLTVRDNKGGRSVAVLRVVCK